MSPATVNPRCDPAAVPPASAAARAFHQVLPGYAPTPTRNLDALAAALGLAAVGLKDESGRLGLPAFKILGASWAVERTLRAHPEVRMLVAASAGNHGRAVARSARDRGLAARIFLPARSLAPRREAIAQEGAEVIVIDGGYEEAVRAAQAAATAPGAALIADVGASPSASWVIDGYATLFAELDPGWDVLLVPTGVGSLAAAACRYAAGAGAVVVAVEPVAAACLTAALVAGAPVRVDTPGTVMAGLDCAEVSPAAWPSLRAGIRGAVTVSDAEARSAMTELEACGLRLGECGAAPLAALRALMTEPSCRELRTVLGVGGGTRVLLLGTEGRTAEGVGMVHRR